jgi:hypothetical protein
LSLSKLKFLFHVQKPLLRTKTLTFLVFKTTYIHSCNKPHSLPQEREWLVNQLQVTLQNTKSYLGIVKHHCKEMLQSASEAGQMHKATFCFMSFIYAFPFARDTFNWVQFQCYFIPPSTFLDYFHSHFISLDKIKNYIPIYLNNFIIC